MIRRALTRASAAFGIVLMLVVVAAAPASAHGVGGLEPTNYKTTVTGIEPPVPGIHVRAIDLDTSIELRNDTAHDVVVLGYQREPYLRIGPKGTWENTRSPAVFLNRTRVPTQSAPHDQYDAKAAPEWKKISNASVARWHDHRTHWMGSEDPAAVRRDPGHTHVVIADWTIPLRDQGRKITVTGDALWVPGPSPWPWVLGAVGLAIAVVALCRTRAWVAVMQGALAVLIVSETIHVIGAWQATTASLGSRALASIYSIGGVIVCVLALVWLRRRDPWAATPAVLIAGLFVLIAGGLADVTTLTRSQLPTTLPVGLGRLTVTVALGLGAGLVIAAASRLRAPPAPRPNRADRSGPHAGPLTRQAGTMPTLFTRIIEGEIPGTFVWRDDVCVAFLSIAPLKPGHTLVVPRAEVDHWIDLDPEVNAHLMRVAQEIATAQQQTFSPVRVGLMIAGLEVPHVHLHVVPIDGMHDLDFGNANPVAPEDLDGPAEQLRAALRAAGAAGVSD